MYLFICSLFDDAVSKALNDRTVEWHIGLVVDIFYGNILEFPYRWMRL